MSSGENQNDEMTLAEFEEGSISYEGVDLISTGDVYFQKLSKKRTQYLEPIVEQIDAYYPEDITDRFDILDPTRWPSTNLDEFGNVDLKELNSALMWNFDWQDLSISWKNLKTQVYGHKDFDEKKKGTAEDFWQFYLLEISITWPGDIKWVVQTLLTVQSSTAEVERIYSMYTHTKTPQRYSLAVPTVEAIVRLKFNGPKRLKDFQPQRFVMDFLKEHSRADDSYRRSQARPKQTDVSEAPQPKKSKCAETEDQNLGELASFDIIACELESQMDVADFDDEI